jgi:hypothetical protein
MRKTILLQIFCLSLSAFFLTPAAWALSFRCNSNVIDVGMHKVEVMQKCGVPSTRDTRVERRALRVRQGNQFEPLPSPGYGRFVEVGREIEIVTEEWLYNFGPSNFMQLLVFEEGRLKTIQSLGYGN